MGHGTSSQPPLHPSVRTKWSKASSITVSRQLACPPMLPTQEEREKEKPSAEKPRCHTVRRETGARWTGVRLTQRSEAVQRGAPCRPSSQRPRR